MNSSPQQNGILKAVQIDTRLHVVSLILACLAIGGMFYKLNDLGDRFEKFEDRLTKTEQTSTAVAVLQFQYTQVTESLQEIKEQQAQILEEVRKRDK